MLPLETQSFRYENKTKEHVLNKFIQNMLLFSIHYILFGR